MSNTIEVRLPDIGDFESVDVIEVQVAPGDRVEKESPLITLESDKATMEIPSPHAGVVGKLLVKVGDKVAEGAPILMLEQDGDEAVEEPAPAVPDAAPDSATPAAVADI